MVNLDAPYLVKLAEGVSTRLSCPYYPATFSGATFSPDLGYAYRYVLWRTWSMLSPAVAFVGLNPSTADHEQSDPTVTRCINYAKAWGFGGMVMLNAFALRSTDPKALYRAEDPWGPLNNDAIRHVCSHTAIGAVIVCWGNHARLYSRGSALRKLILGIRGCYAFGFTKQGQPKHPLYLRGSIRFGDLERIGDVPATLPNLQPAPADQRSAT